MKKRMLTALIVCALLALALTVGCAPRTVTPGTPTTPTETPQPTATPTPTPEPSVTPTSPTPSKERAPIVVYFSYREKMQPVQRYAPAGTVGVLKAALTELFKGPTAAEKAAGLSSQIPSGTKLNSVAVRGNLAIVDISSQYATGGGSLSMLNRVAQVVYTSTQFKTVGAVEFRMNGKQLKTLGGEGIVLSGEQTRTAWEDQAPAILVESPAWGGVLREGETMRGSANVFEATFRIALKDSKGRKLFESSVMASAGTGTRGDWTAAAKLGSTSSKTGMLTVFDLSAKDGKPENVVNIPVVFER